MYEERAVRNANLLFLGTILLVVLLGGFAQSREAGSGLIFTELVCILAPTLLALRREGADWRAAVAWRPARPEQMLLAVPIGFGAWALGAAITAVVVALTGYEAPGLTQPGSAPAGLLLFLGLTLFAPVCEEVLFRGYIYRAYALRGARTAVVVSALLFAFYHLRLQGLPGLLPAAFALGILRWRTGSLLPGVLAHAAQNSVPATVALLAALGVEVPAPWLAGMMPAMLVLGVVAFRRFLQQSPAPSGEEASGRRPARARLGELWPLIPFAVLYLCAAGAEAGLLSVPGAAPSVPKEPPALKAAVFERPEVWRYEVRNVADEVVGSMECRLTPQSASYAVDCRAEIRAWRVERENSVFQSDAVAMEISMRWSRSDLRLLELIERVMPAEGGFHQEIRIAPEGDGLRLTVYRSAREGTSGIGLPAGAVLAEELPWRISLAGLAEEHVYTVALASPSKWDPRLKTSLPAVESAELRLTRGTAGGGKAWQAALGDRLQAWYSPEAPHVLLRLDYMGHSYRLVGQGVQ
ncbi:membrane protease YdiL (CAAX protease family) [Symbiobacterium terraclitae]|uniref:Membrane protease YdiL (CAAX protease family) n=1 Tax=Symbiobacterium terraclitae TaxID=557451 RepID=A0ABS4JUN5_9FIRM|nr:type II CAAX endopeptidase family protein [Symbiobacterium terraclitae]MBP2018586.1 membrane protease YdiL (CAAX protease family) [Symbiobacterium terraclitae]